MEELYLRIQRPLYNVVYRRLWNRDGAMEVVQETFLRLWERRERIRRETIEPLAYRIAVNLAAKRRRRDRLWRWAKLEALRGRGPAADQERDLSGTEEIEVLRRVVESLPRRYRSVVLLCELSEMTYEEVGRALGIPPGTVGSRRNTAMRLMREKFERLTRVRDDVR